MIPFLSSLSSRSRPRWLVRVGLSLTTLLLITLLLITLLLVAPLGTLTAAAQPVTPHPAQHSLALRHPASIDTTAPPLSVGSLLHLGPSSDIRVGPHRETSLEMTVSVGPFDPNPNPWKEMNAGTAALVLGVKLARWARCTNQGLSRYACSLRVEPDESRLYDPLLYAPIGPYLDQN